MIIPMYNPITGQSFTYESNSKKTTKRMAAKAAVEKIQKQKMANLRKTNCKRK